MKILFTISDTGLGHRAAMNAVIAELKHRFNSGIEYKVVDLLKFSKVLLAKDFPELIKKMSQGGLVLIAYNLLFKLTSYRLGFVLTTLFFRIALLFKQRRIKVFFKKEKPDLVININAYTNTLVQWINVHKEYHFKYINIITDLTNINYAWAIGNFDLCVVPNNIAYSDLHKFNVPNVKMLGYPLDRKFLKIKDNGDQEKNKGNHKKKILIFGRNVKKANIVIKTIQKYFNDIIITVICGKNKKVKNYLENNFTNINIIGFTDHVHEFMAKSDIIISKAGPGIIMEAVFFKKPIIITHSIGNQEQENITFVVNNRYGFHCPDQKSLIETVNYIFSSNYSLSTNTFHYEYQTGKIVDNIMEIAEKKILSHK